MHCNISVAKGCAATQPFRNARSPYQTLRAAVIVKSGFKPEVDSSRPRAPDAAPSGSSLSSFNPPPPPPPPPPTPSTSGTGLAPSRRELLFFAAGSLLGGVAHTVYTNKTTFTLTDPETLENLFKEAMLEEEILETKDMVVKLEGVLEQMDDRLAKDEEAIRKGKTDDGRDLEEVREEAQNLRADRAQMMTLEQEMKSAVTEMTKALEEYKAATQKP